MRISDWSSDVCSSDLPFERQSHAATVRLRDQQIDLVADVRSAVIIQIIGAPHEIGRRDIAQANKARQRFPPQQQNHREIGRASCRERVCQYVWSAVVAATLKNKTDKQLKTHHV